MSNMEDHSSMFDGNRMFLIESAYIYMQTRSELRQEKIRPSGERPDLPLCAFA